MEYIYKGDSDITYALSIAATWVWAPAIFVASSMGYYNGIYGLLWFIVPNVLTLIIFGYVAQYAVNKNHIDNCVNVGDILSDFPEQRKLHVIVSAILLCSSTCVQFVGLYELTRYFCNDITIAQTSIAISILCFLYTRNDGIRICIVTDAWKYIIILGIVFSLLYFKEIPKDAVIFGIKNPSFVDITLSFGLTSTIGLLSAPYVDNTFWQRVFSIDKDRIFKVFLYAAVLFSIVPIGFGAIGIMSAHEVIEDWNIMFAYSDSHIFLVVLGASIFLALIATLDSNICAIQSLFRGRKYVELIMLIGSISVCILVKPSIIDLFLIYGTIRTSMCIPTLLVIYERYDKKRLYIGSLIAILIGGIGYAVSSVLRFEYAYIFTLIALCTPFIGISFGKENF